MPTKKKKTKIIKLKLKKSESLFKIKRLAKLMLIFVPLAVIVYFVSASSPTEAPVGSSELCGARVSNYNYQRMYDKNMPWNVPACGNGVPKLEKSLSDDYVNRLWMYSIAPAANNDYEKQRTIDNRGKFMTMFGLDAATDYSTPIYRANDPTNGATTTIQVQVCTQPFCVASNIDSDDYNIKINQGKGYLPDTRIPWNPNWKPSQGLDKEMIILDVRTTPAKEYGLWGVHSDSFSAIANCGLLFRDRLCTYNTSVIRDSKDNIADYKNSTALSGNRGMGIQGSPMVITPEEVEQGEIRQALYMEAFNTMTGPSCTPEQLKTNNTSVVGKTCGFAFAPSTQFEWSVANDTSRTVPGQAAACPEVGKIKDYYTGKSIQESVKIPQMIPPGIRFAITNTDAEIDAWLATKTNYSPAKKKTARIIAIALRDYGWIVGDTTCWGAGFVFSGTSNPQTAAKWKQLGIDDASSQQLLDGLFKKEKIYVVAPPLNQCKDGSKSNFACQSTNSTYPTAGLATASSTTSTPTTTTTSPTPAPTNPTPTTSTPTTTTPTSPVSVTPPAVKISLQPDYSKFQYYINIAITPPTGTTKPVAYSILRNNVPIGKTNGTSYNDYGIQTGIKYTYVAQALDLNGKILATSPINTNSTGTQNCFLIWCSLSQ